ncbi:MAG: S8 family serine peptidase, partial [Candidatus Micrarchaeota archaeon]
MKKLLVFFAALVVLSSVAFAAGDKYFIYFKTKPTREDVDKVSANGALRFTYRDMPVVSAEIPEAAIGALLKNKNIERIEPVEVAYIAVRPEGKPSGGKPQPSQVLPWGIAKINAPNAWNSSTGAGVRVAVLDTGVDRNHPDIAANLLWCKSELGAKSCEDKNGHGTHVAGTLLALNNNIGVVGVAY